MIVVAWSWPTWVVESEICVGSCVHLVGASISFDKNFYRLPFTPPSLVRRVRPSSGISAGYHKFFMASLKLILLRLVMWFLIRLIVLVALFS
jgi:hypothetical protein